MYDRLRYGKMKLGMCMDFTEASQFWIALLKCTPNMKKLWFREIRPRLGEDKKLSTYGIIGKICLTGLREMPTTTHSMMIKIL